MTPVAMGQPLRGRWRSPGRFLGGEVVRAGVGALALGWRGSRKWWRGGGCPAATGRRPCPGGSWRPGRRPRPRRRVALSKKDQAAFHMYSRTCTKSQMTGHGDAAAGGLGGDRLDLGAVAVHQGDPLAAVAGVAALGFSEGGGDDGGDVVGDRGGQPFPGSGRAAVRTCCGRRGDDVGRARGARGRRRRRRPARPSACGRAFPLVTGGWPACSAGRPQPWRWPGAARPARITMPFRRRSAPAHAHQAPGRACGWHRTRPRRRRPAVPAPLPAVSRSSTPVARVIAAAASSNEPRADSTAASFRSPWDCFSSGRFSAASSRCTFGAPGAR